MKITLNKPEPKQLDSVLHSTGWDKTVQIVTAFHLQCSVEAQLFQKPISIKTLLPEPPQLGSTSLMRLLHSNYLRHWQDITEDSQSHVSVSGNKIHISTDRTGWLAVILVQMDASKIAQMAMRSLSVEPIMLNFSVYCQSFPDDINQIAVFVVPCKANGEPIHRDNLKPQHHVTIAFPHTVQAWQGEKLRLDLLGRFEPDASSGERDLSYEFEVQQTHNRIFEKWVELTSKADQSLSGKLIVSACRHADNEWESITEINLSSRRRQYSDSSGSDTHQSWGAWSCNYYVAHTVNNHNRIYNVYTQEIAYDVCMYYVFDTTFLCDNVTFVAFSFALKLCLFVFVCIIPPFFLFLKWTLVMFVLSLMYVYIHTHIFEFAYLT